MCRLEPASYRYTHDTNTQHKQTASRKQTLNSSQSCDNTSFISTTLCPATCTEVGHFNPMAKYGYVKHLPLVSNQSHKPHRSACNVDINSEQSSQHYTVKVLALMSLRLVPRLLREGGGKRRLCWCMLSSPQEFWEFGIYTINPYYHSLNYYCNN